MIISIINETNYRNGIVTFEYKNCKYELRANTCWKDKSTDLVKCPVNERLMKILYFYSSDITWSETLSRQG
jgi:hypothetical protein